MFGLAFSGLSGTFSGEYCDLSSSEIVSAGVIVGGCNDG